MKKTGWFLWCLVLTCFVSRPALAELTDEQKLERCHNNIARITVLRLEAAKIKQDLENLNQLDEQENLARNDLNNIELALGSEEGYWFFFEMVNASQDDLNFYDRWLKPYGVTIKKDHIPDLSPIERDPDDESSPSESDQKEADEAALKKSMTVLLSDLSDAIEKKLDAVRTQIQNKSQTKSQNEARLKEVNELLAYHRGRLEEWNCSALMKTGGRSPEEAVGEEGVWGLVEVISDPGKITENNMYKRTVWLPTAIEIETMEANHYELHHQAWTDASQSKLYQDFHIIVQMDPPPAIIKPGQNFSLNVTGSCTKGTEDMGSYTARFGRYEATGGIDVKMAEESNDPRYKGEPYVGLGNGGFIGNATAVYEFKVPEADKLSSEFTIEQKGFGIFKYKKGMAPIKVEK